jgi:hypothetical protein
MPGRVTGDGGINYWVGFARQHNIHLGFPEWGGSSNGRNTQWAGHAGGDNPFYISTMLGLMKANADIMLVDGYFNESASYIQGALLLAGGGSQLPNMSAAYRREFMQ